LNKTFNVLTLNCCHSTRNCKW